MAGAAREVTDPVEAAKHGIGSSKRLIAATLDDLSDHHSWLETYHRDERLRAERLRRRELRERLERRYRHTVRTTKHAARVSYVRGRSAARFSKRHAIVFTQWAAPRLHTLARHTSETAALMWRWSQRHTPVFTRRAYTAARDSFDWSVQTSEQAGYAFRRCASALSAEVATELQRSIAPLRRRGMAEWARRRLTARRARASVERRLTEAIATSQTVAHVRKKSRRWTIRAIRICAPPTQRAHNAALRIEADLSALILQIVPAFRRLLLAHMPNASPPAKTAAPTNSRALIVRPTTALVCIAPVNARPPAPACL